MGRLRMVNLGPIEILHLDIERTALEAELGSVIYLVENSF